MSGRKRYNDPNPLLFLLTCIACLMAPCGVVIALLPGEWGFRAKIMLGIDAPYEAQTACWTFDEAEYDYTGYNDTWTIRFQTKRDYVITDFDTAGKVHGSCVVRHGGDTWVAVSRIKNQ